MSAACVRPATTANRADSDRRRERGCGCWMTSSSARRPGEEPGGCADRPLHAREEAPQRDHDHEHDAVARRSARRPTRRLPVRPRPRARCGIRPSGLSCSAIAPAIAPARSCRGRRPRRPPEQGGRRQYQNAEQAPRDRAVVRQVQSESQSLGHPIILTRPRSHPGQAGTSTCRLSGPVEPLPHHVHSGPQFIGRERAPSISSCAVTTADRACTGKSW